MTAAPNITQQERFGPAERIIDTCLRFTDHLYHGRPGIILVHPSSPIGVTWKPVSHVVEDVAGLPRTIVLAMPDLPATPAGAKKPRKGRAPKGPRPPGARLGVLDATGDVIEETTGVVVGRYRAPGLFPEAAAYLYRQVAEVWRVDNEFAGRWASYAWTQDHEDLRTVLCAFMLCQSRVGAPQAEGGKLLFHDLNLRDVGRAMLLLTGTKDHPGLNAKLVLRIRKLLGLPEIVAINRELGFTHGPRSKGLKGWKGAARSWLAYRERNPKLLEGLVRVGFRGTVRTIATTSEYKADTPAFYRALRWEQEQDLGGRRKVAIGVKLAAAPTWAGLSEVAICERIVAERPDWKRIVGMLPPDVGATRAIVATAIESGSFSDKDLIIATPTLEELGLLEVQDIKARWDRARQKATDQRALHIARNVTTKAVADELVEAGEGALKKAIEEDVRDLEVFVFVDRSGSMQRSIEAAVGYLGKFVYAFPLERLHVAVFNSVGSEITIRHASAAGVANAFKGVQATGGTSHREGVKALAHHKYVGQNAGPVATRDNLWIFVGDEGEAVTFADAVRATGLDPVAFGLLKVPGDPGNCVERTAAELGIPCFRLELAMFDDPAAIPRTLRRLIQSTPATRARESVAAPKRKSLVETILATPLLAPPEWA